MYRCALPEGPVRSASRGSPAAKSIRLALRTSSIVATRRASFVRWVLRCFGRRRLSSSPKLPAISVMPSMIRFQVPPRADSLNHTPTRHVNNLLLKLIDGKNTLSARQENKPSSKDTSAMDQDAAQVSTILVVEDEALIRIAVSA